MRTIYPPDPITSFNDWAKYIHEELVALREEIRKPNYHCFNLLKSKSK